MRIVFDEFSAHFEPRAQGVERLAADRHDAAPVALAENLDFRRIELEPAGGTIAVGIGEAGVEADQFGEAQARRIKQFEDGVIAQPFGGCRRRALPSAGWRRRPRVLWAAFSAASAPAPSRPDWPADRRVRQATGKTRATPTGDD
jgi:hypothetical protein